MANQRSPIKEGSKETVCGPLKHPLRARILEVVNVREISPIQFVNEGLEPEGFVFKSHENAVSHVAYHFRVLEEIGCIELIDRRQRRGATEHIYRGLRPLFFSEEDFEEMPLEQRDMLSRVSMQGLIARADSAIRAGTFDARTDRHLTWTPLMLDERGWKEMLADMETLFHRVNQIQEDARERIASSDCEVIPATCAMLAFPSPPPPLPPDVTEAEGD
jgi:hypothetical protein